MTSFESFCANCKMRHDYGDQIQVRFNHPNGEAYDTWVSGEEILSRLDSEVAEARRRELRNLNWRQIRKARERLPDEVRDRAERTFLDYLADGVDETIGGNLIGDNLSNSVRDRNQEEPDSNTERKHWTTIMYDERFRSKVLELAWIQLEGSFPDIKSDEEPDDWV